MHTRFIAGLMGCCLLLLGACQLPDEAVVGIKGRQYPRSLAEVAKGQLTSTLRDADYPLVLDMALLSAIG